MTTIELEPVERTEHSENDDEEHRVCHLYRSDFLAYPSNTMCGIPASQDWHAKGHSELGPGPIWEKGQMSCPVCGAPVCMDCLLAAS